MRPARARIAAAALLASLLALLLSACGSEPKSGPFALVVQPEFVQGALPGEPVMLLAAVEGETAGTSPVTLTAAATGGATIDVEPASISPGELAEVTVVAADVTEETEIEVTVTARRGDEEHQTTKPIVVMPQQDELEPAARDVLGLFLPWLAEQQPELGIGPDTELTGMVVAPRLLVVSHYAFLNEDYEIGLAWHIMIPPDDWADLYIRPRDSLRPTVAFRLSSWSTALAGGDVEIVPTELPAEVVR